MYPVKVDYVNDVEKVLFTLPDDVWYGQEP
jgi:hypothetical protein